MFMTPQSIKAETAYRQEKIKRDFRRATRRTSQEQTAKAEPRHARRTLRPTHAA